jgi:arylformamidase
MTNQRCVDWEDAFVNGAYITDGKNYPELWRRRAADFRASSDCELDIAYGEHPRERLDLFFPKETPRGLAVIVHGGYWLNFDKSSWSDLAAGVLAQGWTAALPSYPLALQASIGAITHSIGRAITFSAARIPGPIRLAGHSAGGHLVSRMVCDDAPLPASVSGRVDRVVSISGLHDLRPLRSNSMNAKLKLDAQSALDESPASHNPLTGPQVIAWVGALERPEFLRQSALLVESWKRKGASARLCVEAERHHFDVIDGLKDVRHPLGRAFGE